MRAREGVELGALLLQPLRLRRTLLLVPRRRRQRVLLPRVPRVALDRKRADTARRLAELQLESAALDGGVLLLCAKARAQREDGALALLEQRRRAAPRFDAYYQSNV